MIGNQKEITLLDYHVIDMDAQKGFTNIKPVDGWFGGENQGAGTTLVDINGNGQPDAVFFHIDNPAQANFGYYRIGWDLNILTGDVSGWSDVKPGGCCDSPDNQGAGVTTSDINNNGPPRLNCVLY